jgi:methionyl-tRNA synthetase
VATWGNLVNRAVSFAAKNIGAIPEAGELTAADRGLLENSAKSFAAVGEHLGRSRFKAAIGEAMRTVSEANKYFSDQEPWKLRKSDPERMATVLHVTLQAVDDAKTLLTPFLPRSSQAVYEMLGGTGDWSGMPRIETVDEEGGPSYPVITGEYDTSFRWESRPVTAGTKLDQPKPLFTKLDQSVVDEEIARLGDNDNN